MVGERHNRLVVLEEAPPYVHGGKKKRRWLCRCDCGGETITTAYKLRSGHTTSCGCRQQENRTKHGGHGSTTYHIWDGMNQRCHNKNGHKFYMYGRRGIRVCARWRNSFANFLADMGERPEGMTLDRIDNERGYEPANCRWATRNEQQRNMRSNHVVKYRDREMSVAEAAEIAGVKANSLYPLLNHKGLSIEEAIRHLGG